MNEEQLDDEIRSFLATRADATIRATEPAFVVAERAIARTRAPHGAFLRVALLSASLAGLVAAAIAGIYVGTRGDEAYAPPELVSKVALRGRPAAVAAAFGSVWVGANRESVVFRVDPLRARVQDEVRTPFPLCGSIEPGHGGLWFGHCAEALISRLDPATLSVTRVSGLMTDRPGIGAGSVWVSDGRTNVVRMNPNTFETIAEIGVGGPTLATFGFGSAWAIDTDSGVVSRIDPATNEVVATVALPPPVAGGPGGPVHAVAGEGAVWVVHEGELAVYRIDPATNEAARLDVRLDRLRGGTGFGDHFIALGQGGVWIRDNETTILRLDPRSQLVVEEYETGRGGGGFAVAPDALWVASLDENSVWGIATR